MAKAKPTKKPSSMDALVASALTAVGSEEASAQSPIIDIPSYVPPAQLPNPFHSVPTNEDVRHSMFLSFIKNTNMELSDDQKKQIKTGIEKLDSSFLNIVRGCNPEKCHVRHICPFTPSNKYPVGQLCPVDKSIADFIFNEYERYLREETSNVGGSLSIVERSTLAEIVECDLEDFRVRAKLVCDGEIVSTPAFAVNRTGEVINHDIENPIYNIREKLARRKQRLLQRLLLTPESKAKFHIQTGDRNTKDQIAMIKASEDKVKQFLLTQAKNAGQSK